MTRNLQIVYLIGCLFPLVLTAQQPFFREHDVPEELEGTAIRHLYQSDGHFLWLGTDDGLVLFDGHRYQRILRTDSLADNRVSSLYRDQNDRLWVGYRDGGIFHHDQFHQLQIWEPEEGWPRAPVTAFAEDRAGNIWLATYGEGLYYWTGKRLYNFATDDGLSGNEVYTISSDQRGRIWAATDGGISICHLENGQKKVAVLGRDAGLPDEIVRVIEPDESGNCWVGTYEKGFGYVSGTEGRVLFWIAEWDHGVITALEMSSPDELWLGTEKSGVFRYAPGSGKLSECSPDHFRNARINELHRDAEGNIWVVKNNHELLSASLLFEFIDGGIREVQSLLVDGDGHLWAGTQNGLFLRETMPSGRDTFRLVQPGNFLSLFQDHYRNIWAGTFGAGVFIFKPGGGTPQLLSEADGLTNGSILSIDGYGNKVWLATLGGVTELSFTMDPALPGAVSLQNYRHEDGLGTNFIYKVYVDSRRRVWFGTDGEGLSLLDQGTFRNISETDSLEIRSVYSITEDHDHNIWFSTPKEGIFRFDGKMATRFERSRGLRERSIVGLATDYKNQLLLIHPSGIDLFNPQEERLIHYDDEVGIGDIQPNLNAFFQDEEGSIWIGTQSGIIRYAGKLPVQQIMPEVQLTGVSVDLQPVNFTQTSEFPHHKNNLIFDYSGLWYSNPEAVRYRYKLDGYNPDWIVSRDQRAVYSQLPPGDYTFRLSASDNDLFFPEPQVVYQFRINLPFWNSPWFAILVALVSIGSIYMIMRTREERLHRQSVMRREKLVHQFELLKSQINPHFLFNNFNTLITLIEEDPPAAVNYVERLADFYRSILQYRESPVVSLEEELGLLRNYTALLRERFADNLQIRICDQLRSGYIIPLTLQLLVENAIKHNVVGRDQPLTIRISEARPGYVVVTNNLQEKWTPEPSTGFGLESISKRYALLTDKKVQLEKNDKEFSVSIPLLDLMQKLK
ncbi:two-component regulator propeller domain-containing protein [Flavilitoribacter nigricans]|uniref:Histidine kinase n=1 Tax=Flavilitoribacter nigricans (strain ATCC 23147 / DSM 23189 / NBRC 102662 / NCIMB 1420 / SS-2) TaxID=1122177 RepID=A0A2D0NHJ2_FLAN2|nr:two-component regulator propeller domain-containing protein [Flavilitoribacter nigricans]PHN07951.1 hypothetical protein CRP01_04130 [Flavilitoribacter nigricans DSM 23189 = NBRC 102662]